MFDSVGWVWGIGGGLGGWVLGGVWSGDLVLC